MPSRAAAAVGLERHAKAGVMTPVSACASGAEAIARAWQQIVLGEADAAICGGVETRIEAVPIAGFAQMRIVMSTNNDDPPVHAAHSTGTATALCSARAAPFC